MLCSKLLFCFDVFFRSSFGLYRFQEEGPFKGLTPKARSGHRIVYYKGSIFSFGGYNPKVRIFWIKPYGQYIMDTTLRSIFWTFGGCNPKVNLLADTYNPKAIILADTTLRLLS